ncbi:uncharacterized protein [Vicugna pacos]|uniref:Uncharacterized protein isoform X2 n=1 Tax=Vicugna pacos TaxID=30538 RepID=A0ABM5BIA1_VICPA
METAGRDKDREGEGEGSHMGAGQTWNVGWHCPSWPRRGSSGARQGVQKAGVCEAGEYSRQRHSVMENLPPPLEEPIPGTCHVRAMMPPHRMWPARPSPRDVSWRLVQLQPSSAPSAALTRAACPWCLPLSVTFPLLQACDSCLWTSSLPRGWAPPVRPTARSQHRPRARAAQTPAVAPFYHQSKSKGPRLPPETLEGLAQVQAPPRSLPTSALGLDRTLPSGGSRLGHLTRGRPTCQSWTRESVTVSAQMFPGEPRDSSIGQDVLVLVLPKVSHMLARRSGHPYSAPGLTKMPDPSREHQSPGQRRQATSGKGGARPGSTEPEGCCPV